LESCSFGAFGRDSSERAAALGCIDAPARPDGLFYSERAAAAEADTGFPISQFLVAPYRRNTRNREFTNILTFSIFS